MNIEIKTVFDRLGLDVPKKHDPEIVLKGLYKALENLDQRLIGGGRATDLETGWTFIVPTKVEYRAKDLIEMINRSNILPTEIKNWATDITRQQKDIPDLIEEILVKEGLLEKPYIIIDKPIRR